MKAHDTKWVFLFLGTHSHSPCHSSLHHSLHQPSTCNPSILDFPGRTIMGFGALRNAIRPLSRTLITHTGTSSTTPFLASRPEFRLSLGGGAQSPWTQMIRHFSFLSEAHPFDRLTSTRFPKRRPVDKPRRKRASLKPPGNGFDFFIFFLIWSFRVLCFFGNFVVFVVGFRCIFVYEF